MIATSIHHCWNSCGESVMASVKPWMGDALLLAARRHRETCPTGIPRRWFCSCYPCASVYECATCGSVIHVDLSSGCDHAVEAAADLKLGVAA